jgi:hypothetical protein
MTGRHALVWQGSFFDEQAWKNRKLETPNCIVWGNWERRLRFFLSGAIVAMHAYVLPNSKDAADFMETGA